ncbi:hypothetical protein [Scytonema sp. HK-05]|nr:hypothetical protein [Scytonema sp. HK-05]
MAVSTEVEYNHRLKAQKVSKQPKETQPRLPIIDLQAEYRGGIE